MVSLTLTPVALIVATLVRFGVKVIACELTLDANMHVTSRLFEGIVALLESLF